MARDHLIAPDELAGLVRPWGGRGPAYAALAESLRVLVLDGRLPLGARLPSERRLAPAIGVSRTTTAAAYDVLRAEGYLESRQGSGSRVALPTGGTLDREFGSHDGDSRPGAIDLTIAALPAPGAMTDAVAAATAELAAYLGGTGYDPRGLPVFRRVVVERFEERGVPTRDEQVVVTSGAQHALALLLRVLVTQGDRVLVESPTYPNALEAIRQADAVGASVPVPEDGWDVGGIAATMRRDAPRLAYLVPEFHNPTGCLMPDADRSALVEAGRRAEVPLVVDETFGELDLEPWRPSPAPVAHHNPDDVITIGSMSKGYWGGLRVGWIRCAPTLAHRLAHARAGLDLATPVFEQLVAARLLRAAAAVSTERRALLRERRDALVAALRRELPSWSFGVPRGGLSLWVRLDGVESGALARSAEAEGVRLVPGRMFGWDEAFEERIRLPYTQPPNVLDAAVSKLARATSRLAA
jgi:DNA-binding transcriptional MocR family regulator